MSFLGVPVAYRSSRDLSREELASLRALLREGASLHEAAQALGVSHGKVYYVCKKLSIPTAKKRKEVEPLFSRVWRAK